MNQARMELFVDGDMGGLVLASCAYCTVILREMHDTVVEDTLDNWHGFLSD